MSELSGQTAVITGATSGVGRAIALRLASEGVRLCLVGRRKAALEEVAQRASAQGAPPDTPAAKGYRADLSSETDLAALISELEGDLTEIDILVHSAGEILFGRIEAASGEDLDRQYQVNFRAPYVLTRALLPLMKPKRGQIIFINSSVGLAGKGGAGPYAATKHALKAFADSLRDEVNPSGIRVTSFYLGRTATPMQERVHASENRDYFPELLLQPEDVASSIVNVLSLPRTAEVTDISIRPLAKLP